MLATLVFLVSGLSVRDLSSSRNDHTPTCPSCAMNMHTMAVLSTQHHTLETCIYYTVLTHTCSLHVSPSLEQEADALDPATRSRKNVNDELTLPHTLTPHQPLLLFLLPLCSCFSPPLSSSPPCTTPSPTLPPLAAADGSDCRRLSPLYL